MAALRRPPPVRVALALLAQIVLLATPLSGEMYLPSWLSSDSGATTPMKKPSPSECHVPDNPGNLWC